VQKKTYCSSIQPPQIGDDITQRQMCFQQNMKQGQLTTNHKLDKLRAAFVANLPATAMFPNGRQALRC
jgi:hypothetical protein